MNVKLIDMIRHVINDSPKYKGQLLIEPYEFEKVVTLIVEECCENQQQICYDYAEIVDNTSCLPTISESSILNSPNYANI
jgi:hypothetical protein